MQDQQDLFYRDVDGRAYLRLSEQHGPITYKLVCASGNTCLAAHHVGGALVPASIGNRQRHCRACTADARLRTAKRVEEALERGIVPTIADVIDGVSRSCSEKYAQNVVSVLNKIVEEEGATVDWPAPSFLFADDELEAFLQRSIYANGGKSATSRKSMIRAAARIARELLGSSESVDLADALGISLSDLVTFWFVRSGLAMKDLLKLRALVKEIMGSEQRSGLMTRATANRLFELFGVESQLERELAERFIIRETVKPTPSGKRSVFYGTALPIPPAFEADRRVYSDWKAGLLRTSRFPIPVNNNTWTPTHRTKLQTTEGTFRYWVQGYTSFLVRQKDVFPGGCGIDPKSVCFLDLFDVDRLRAYARLRLSMSESFVGNLVKLLKYAVGMLHPVHGFVGARLGLPGGCSDEFASRVVAKGLCADIEGLAEWRAQATAGLRELLIELQQKEETGEKEPARKHVIEKEMQRLGHERLPVIHLHRALDRLVKALPPQSVRDRNPVWTLNKEINITYWVAFLSWPARMNTWLSIQMGDVEVVGPSEIRIRTKLEYFKNRQAMRALKIEPPTIQLTGRLATMLIDYAERIRPAALAHLERLDESWKCFKNFLVPGLPPIAADGESSCPNLVVSTKNVCRRMKSMAFAFLGSDEITAHAFRTVISTSLELAGHSGEQAAGVLGDSKEIVEKFYSYAVAKGPGVILRDLHQELEIEA